MIDPRRASIALPQIWSRISVGSLENGWNEFISLSGDATLSPEMALSNVPIFKLLDGAGDRHLADRLISWSGVLRDH
jgi:hypothetical protein